MILEIPINAWFGDERIPIDLPDSWDVTICNITGAKPLCQKNLKESFETPIGSPRISELADKKKKVVIVVEDISRPSPTMQIIPLILDELKEGGVPAKNVVFVMATGAHRPLTEEELIKKLGKEVYERCRVENHLCRTNLVYVGKSSFSTEIYLNKTVFEADLKIGVGGIYPHGPGVGMFGGGAKILIPGVAGVDTITQNHIIPGFGNQRKEMVEIARRIDFNVIVNAVINDRRNIVGLFVGDIVDAHRKGVEFAKKVYQTSKPRSKVDVAITNAYPLDIDLGQSMKALKVGLQCLREYGSIVLIASCKDGGGYHALYHRGGTLWEEFKKSFKEEMGKTRFIIFSQNLTKDELYKRLPEGPLLFNSWRKLRNFLVEEYGRDSRVAVFPTGCISI